MIKNLCNKIILIFFCVMFIWIPLTSCSSNQKGNKKSITNSSLSNRKQLLSNVTFTVPETSRRVNFNQKKGTVAEYRTSESVFAEHGVVTLLTDHIQPIGGNKFVTFFAVNRGGSGTEIYLAVFGFENNVSQMKGYQFLGDRIQIVSLSVDHSQNIHIAYKIHGLTQPMADAPNVLVQKTFSYQQLVLETNKNVRFCEHSLISANG